ncbi:MAG: hypothetical protein ACRDVW_10750, partial [Acidimicrobiales bacterium]
RTPAEFDGTEIEIRRLPYDWDGTHVAVRSRPATGHPVFAAVFGSLEEGEYEIRRRHVHDDLTVQHLEVIGGAVVEEIWQG